MTYEEHDAELEDPDVEFFAERGGDVEPAKAVCARCLVRTDCLDYARSPMASRRASGAPPAAVNGAWLVSVLQADEGRDADR
jgi:Transcription factor WhiB